MAKEIEIKSFLDTLDQIKDSLVDLQKQQAILEKAKQKFNEKEYNLLERFYKSNIEMELGVDPTARHQKREKLERVAKRAKGQKEKSQRINFDDIPLEMFDDEATIDIPQEEKRKKAQYVRPKRRELSKDPGFGELLKVGSLELLTDIMYGIPFLLNKLTDVLNPKAGGEDAIKDVETKKAQKEQKEQADKTNDLLEQINENTTKEKETLKGGSLADIFKGALKFLGPIGSLLLTPLSAAGAFGVKMLKLAGPFMIFGGVMSLLGKFIEGFNEGGVSGGLVNALVGQFNGKLMDTAFSNAGTYALIGAGIGSMIAPGVGTIAGGLIGASLGVLINYIGRLFSTDEATISDKMYDFFVGGTGRMGVMFNGMKYAAIGALVGTFVAPGIGTIVGGLIGGAVGALINIIGQMFPEITQVNSAIYNFFINIWSAQITWLKDTFFSMFETTKNIFSWIIDTITAPAIYLLKKFGVWEKLKKWWNDSSVIIDKGIEIFKDVLSIMSVPFKWISDKFTSFKNVISSRWNNIWDNEGSASRVIKEDTKPEMNPTKEMTKNVEKQTDNIKNVLGSENLAGSIVKGTKATFGTVFGFIKHMIPKIINVIDSGFKKLMALFRDINEENRQWEFRSKTGSLTGYTKQVEEHSKALTKMSGSKEEMKKSTEAQGNINTVNNNINNTINGSSVAPSLRK